MIKCFINFITSFIYYKLIIFSILFLIFILSLLFVLNIDDNKNKDIVEKLVVKENIHFNELVNSNYENEFNNKVNELLKLKYPLFIYEHIINNEYNIKYTTKENKLIIEYFKEDKIYSLDVYYNEIKDYINYDVDLILDYSNEDGNDFDPNKMSIAITFDDGPHPYQTPEIVRILDENKATGTFFMLGNRMDLHRDIVKLVYDHGNEIGLHGITHRSFRYMTDIEVQDELSISNNILFEVTNTRTNLVRPPYGALTVNNVTNLPYSYILWSKDSTDWKNKDTNYLVNHILNNVENGDIILFHDLYPTSVEALNILLPELYNRGFQVVSVSKLAEINNQNIELNQIYYKF